MEKKDLEKGHIHPITQTIVEIVEIFRGLGFVVADGPEIETEFYNFNALNVPPDHPARDMQDTFWLRRSEEVGAGPRRPEEVGAGPRRSEEVGAGPRRSEEVGAGPRRSSEEEVGAGPRRSSEEEVGVPTEVSGLKLLSERRVLRTQTSAIQVRYMEVHKPPLRIIAPGKIFRNEATDATHEAQFYQIEGLMIEKDITVANLKGILEYFLKKLFGESVEIRLRPSYFPFVEPGFEVDMSCSGCIKNTKAGGYCPMCKGTTWIEIMGAGMVHPNVLTAVGLDPKEWKGLAFGTGLDRLVMLKYGVEDIRHLYSGDLRFVNQF